MLTRSCCCGGCFDINDCPLAYGMLGDFTYTADIDTGLIVGNLALSAVTTITANPVLAPSACYASLITTDKCCVSGINCTYPTPGFEESYFDMMLPAELFIETTNYPCYTVIRRDTQIPAIIYKKRCTTPKQVTGKACQDTYPIDCSQVLPSCYQGPAPNYLTQLVTVTSSYALTTNSSTLCGDWSAEFGRGVEFGDLTVGSGTLRMRRNAQSTFAVDVLSGTGLTDLSYWHRANICTSGPSSACGPCTPTPGGTSQRCSDGRCCCRSVLQFTFSIERVWYPLTYVWSGFTADFNETQGAAQHWRQTVRCVYEGPVDERLYRVTGTSSIRTFTLLNATVYESAVDPGPGTNMLQFTNDYCPWDVYGSPGTSVGPTGLGTTTVVNDDCEPCLSAVPPTPAVLSLEQAEKLGIQRLLTVTRTTP